MAAHHQWWNDVFLNLFFDDRLWAHMIRGAEWLRMVDRKKINDLLLLLLCIGVLDWKTPNDHLHQATQAIRHGTAIALHFLPRIMKLESQVRRVIKRLLFSSCSPIFENLVSASTHTFENVLLQPNILICCAYED